MSQALNHHKLVLEGLASIDFDGKGESFVERRFITPFLGCLGYEVHKDYEVRRHGDDGVSFKLHYPPVEEGAKRVKHYNPDYVPTIRKQMFWIIEAKSPGSTDDPFEPQYLTQAFQYCIHPDIMTKWAEDYAKNTGQKIVYRSVGSGAGIKKIQAGEVDFGASDKPLSTDELKAAGLCQFPIVIGGVVPVVNLPGLKTGEIKFTGQLLADIFMGKVTAWNAAEIATINPGLTLPSLPISAVHRSDSSGTTFNWVSFLSRTSAAWKDKVGSGLSVAWPVGVGGDGNAGVAAAVAQTSGAIGYVEYTYALQNTMTYGQVQNGHGLFILPNVDTFQSAASTVDWKYFKDFNVSIGDAAGAPDAYPITATTFVLMYRTPKDTVKSAAALAFFKWALEDGDNEAGALHYVALPPNLVKQVEMYWTSEIQGQRSSSKN